MSCRGPVHGSDPLSEPTRASSRCLSRLSSTRVTLEQILVKPGCHGFLSPARMQIAKELKLGWVIQREATRQLGLASEKAQQIFAHSISDARLFAVCRTLACGFLGVLERDARRSPHRCPSVWGLGAY